MTPITSALAILKSAKGRPNSAPLTRIESTPVCGVLIKKAIEAPLVAPCRLRLRPTGITEHEHKGSGTPMAAAFSTLQRPERCRRMKSGGISACKPPAMAVPKSSQGANSNSVCHIDSIMPLSYAAAANGKRHSSLALGAAAANHLPFGLRALLDRLHFRSTQQATFPQHLLFFL